MHFLKPDDYQPLAEIIFQQLRSKILDVLPDARIEHTPKISKG
jgi:hypothetical protein